MIPAPEGAKVEGEKLPGESKLPVEDLLKKHDGAIGQIMMHLQRQSFEAKARQQAYKEWQEEAKDADQEYRKKTRMRRMVIGSLGFGVGSLLASVFLGVALLPIGGMEMLTGSIITALAPLATAFPALGSVIGTAANSFVSLLPFGIGAAIRGLDFFVDAEEKLNKNMDKNLPEAQRREEIMARNPNLEENKKVLDFQIAEQFKNGIMQRREAAMKQAQEKATNTEVKKDQLPKEVLQEMKSLMAAK